VIREGLETLGRWQRAGISHRLAINVSPTHLKRGNLVEDLFLDDFGIGSSSLAWLSRIPIDEMKIDQTYWACGWWPKASRPGSSVTGLWRWGVRWAQGWLFGRPVPAGKLPWNTEGQIP